jgi:ribonuclease G
MNRSLRLDRWGPLDRAALVADGELTDLHLDRDDLPSLTGAVMAGTVTRLVPGLDAAFVDIGGALPALLNASDVRPRARDRKIGQMLRAGQRVIVQVKADAHDNKGAVVSMDISLSGRFLVHLPLGEGIHLSKRLGRGAERASLLARLKPLLPSGGWIVRGSAATAPAEGLAAEADYLSRRWFHAARSGEPAPTAFQRAILDWAGAADAIVGDGAAVTAAVADWLGQAAPDLLPRLRTHPGPEPLFQTDDLDGAIRTLVQERVPLPGGGDLIIQPTAALTVIDVNGGERAIGPGCSPLSTNLAAGREIARQLRLRNIGGIIIVDFINLAKAAEREELILAMSGAVAEDAAGTQVHGLSKLGLMELTRSRRGPAVAALLRGLV